MNGKDYFIEDSLLIHSYKNLLVYTFLKVNAIFKIINPELYFKDLLYDREARKVLPFFLQYLARAELF